MAPMRSKKLSTYKAAIDRIITGSTTTSVVKTSTSIIKHQPQPFLARNIRAIISNNNTTPVHKIEFYLRKYQDEKWAGDITRPTRDKIDELLSNCDDAEEETRKDTEKSKLRFERMSRMIQLAFKKVRPLIEDELDRARRQRMREGERGRCIQGRKW